MNYSRARRVDAPEGDPPRNREGMTGGLEGALFRTRGRQSAKLHPVEAAKPRDPVAVMYEEMHARWDTEKAANEAADVADRQERDAIQKRFEEMKAAYIDCGFEPVDAARRARERMEGR